MVSSLLVGAAVVLVDSDPAWPALDAEWPQWAIEPKRGATFLGARAGYLAGWAHSGLHPAGRRGLSRLREITASGSPLAADIHAWIYDAVSPGLAVAPTSGGHRYRHRSCRGSADRRRSRRGKCLAALSESTSIQSTRRATPCTMPAKSAGCRNPAQRSQLLSFTRAKLYGYP